MRTWFVRLVLVAAVAAAGFWTWRFFFPSPEQIVRKRLGELALAASIAPNEAPLTKLSKTQHVASLFTSDAQITLDVPGRSNQTINGRDEIQQAVMGARSFLSSLKVQFLDIDVTLGPDKQSAQAHLTATANLPGEKLPEVQELEIGFRNVNHDWLINHVETVKTLR